MSGGRAVLVGFVGLLWCMVTTLAFSSSHPLTQPSTPLLKTGPLSPAVGRAFTRGLARIEARRLLSLFDGSSSATNVSSDGGSGAGNGGGAAGVIDVCWCMGGGGGWIHAESDS